MGVSYNTSIVRKGLVLHLDAANFKSYPGTGTEWLDLSGNSNDGTLVNGVGFDSDNKGSMTFDGVDEFVSTEVGINSFFVENGVTLTKWVKFSENNKDMLSGSLGSSRLYVGRHGNSGTFQAGAGSTFSRDAKQLISNVWYNLTVVFADGSADAFVNTDLIHTFSTSFSATPATFFVGDLGEESHNYDGNISNVKIYNRALSITEVQQNFEALRGRYGI